MQLAIGTYIYRKCGSKLIIDILSKLGTCATYHSVQLHEASTIMDPPKFNLNNAIVQFLFDNTDHNVATLDGHKSFHCLAGIAVYTPHYKVLCERGSKKPTKMPLAPIPASQKQITNIPCGLFNGGGLDKVRYSSVFSLDLGNISALPVHYSAYL